MLPVPLSRHSTQNKYRLQLVLYVQLFVKQITASSNFKVVGSKKTLRGGLMCIQKLCLHKNE